MSLSGSRVGLKHRCTIERKTLVSDGGGGSTESWSAVETDLPCRAWMDASSLAQAGDRVVEVEDRRVLVPADSDVQPGDRIIVTWRSQPFMSLMPISSVGRRDPHLELVCREVS